jgi:hypothetical protein
MILELKNCLSCGISFNKKRFVSIKKWDSTKCCSRKCADKARIGHSIGVKGVKRPSMTGDKHPMFGTHPIPWNKGKKCPQIGVLSLGKPQPWHSGEKSNLWKGGITPVNAAIRTSLEYKNWRRFVFGRDDYTCQECGIRGVYLHADHIKPFAYFPELRFETSNGRTLCVPCHKETDTYMGRAKKWALNSV